MIKERRFPRQNIHIRSICFNSKRFIASDQLFFSITLAHSQSCKVTAQMKYGFLFKNAPLKFTFFAKFYYLLRAIKVISKNDCVHCFTEQRNQLGNMFSRPVTGQGQ